MRDGPMERKTNQQTIQPAGGTNLLQKCENTHEKKRNQPGNENIKRKKSIVRKKQMREKKDLIY